MRKRTPSNKPPHRATLKTVASVIKALGGEAELAAWTGNDRSIVRSYRRWGYIPAPWYILFAARLRELGYEVDPGVFGFKTHAAGASSGEVPTRRRARAR
jgi:hypothetical protein